MDKRFLELNKLVLQDVLRNQRVPEKHWKLFGEWIRSDPKNVEIFENSLHRRHKAGEFFGLIDLLEQWKRESAELPFWQLVFLDVHETHLKSALQAAELPEKHWKDFGRWVAKHHLRRHLFEDAKVPVNQKPRFGTGVPPDRKNLAHNWWQHRPKTRWQRFVAWWVGFVAFPID